MDNSIQKIKQPAPSISSSNIQDENKKYKIIRNANIGVIQMPKTSNTPLTDWVEIKRQENPRLKYKVTFKQNKLPKFDTIAGLGVIVCAIVSVIKLFKNK